MAAGTTACAPILTDGALRQEHPTGLVRAFGRAVQQLYRVVGRPRDGTGNLAAGLQRVVPRRAGLSLHTTLGRCTAARQVTGRDSYSSAAYSVRSP